MKLKNKMIVICLIFFILISISAVSAANNNSEIITNNNNDGDILSVNSLSDKEILSTGEGSFADLNTTINGDSSTTIELDKDYAYTGSDNFTNGITINKNNLTIDGKGHTIDAKGQSRIFYITSTTVILKNIKFVNGNAKQGGAIYGYGDNLRVYNCTFVNNNASGWGGAVYSYPDSLAIFANSTFTNNHAKYGGAISNIYGYKQYVINCSFYSNQATDYGGAVLVYGVQPTTERPYADQFYIVGCKFIDNKAPIGDAISNLHSATLNITNCILLGNASNIIDAETYFTYADYNWFGNTYDNRSVSPNIVKYVKVNNWLYMDLVPQIETASATVSINNLYNNKTGETSTYTTSRLPSIDVDIRAVNANLSSDKVSLDNTGKAEINFALLGDCELMATYESSSVSKKIKGGSFAELQKLIRAANDGDTIVLQKDYVYIKGVDVMTQGIQIEDKHDLVIDGNGHTINAGGNTRVFAVDKQSNHITFKNMNIVNGYVYSAASGAGLVMESDYSQIINCTFINNTANSLNGGAALYGHATHTNVTGCRFINNTQEYSAAGALYWRGEDLTISNTLFENNYALDYAGAVEVYDGGNICNCTFAYNKADYAGAIFNYGHINIDGCTFIGNEALDEDGLKAGGAIYTGNATITKTTFVYNKARIGAAIATAGKGVLIEECIFINNTANSANGIIFVMAEGGQVINSIFLNNSVLYNGYVISAIAANFKADYNWFGHTWKNYKTNWDVSNLADMTKWLFLNATDIIFDEDTGSLKTSFTFMEYDSSTGSNIHYDVGELPAVNLTLSSQNLTLNKNAVNVGDDIDGTTTNYKGLLVAQYENVKYELPFKYLKQSSIVVNSTINVIKGNTENFHFSVLPFEDDYIPFLINSNRITITCNDTSVAKIVKKNFNYKIQGLKLGLAEITIKFNGIDVVGRDKYTPATATILVNVTRCPTHIKLIYNVSDMEVGDSGNIVATLNDDKNKSATGSLEYINNNETVLNFAGGSFRALAEGLANVTIVFAGNTNYEPCSLEVTFNVGRKPTTITVDSNELEMKPGNIHYLGPSINGSSAYLFNCTSNDTDVATINEEGHVTAIGPGIAKLTIRYEGNERYLPAVTYVTVKVSRIPTHIEVESQKELNKSDWVSIGAVLKDDNNKTVLVPPIYPDQNYTKVYTINDTSVLTIDENGMVTAVGVGSAKVTIEFRGYREYGPSNATVVVKVVSPKNKITVEPEINIHVGENKYVNATLQYRILSNLQYVSNDTKVVSVDKNGKLTGIAEGTAEITILLKDDKKFSDANATAIVRVTKGVTTIDAPDTISLYIDGSDYIRANLTSEWENKRLYNLIYESSNNRIVKVDKSIGLIRALKEGQANITISFKESNKYYGASKNVLVIVTLIPTTINVGKTVSLFTGESELINASLMPSGIGSLTFVSSDDKVASVDENGLITAVGAGQANITVSFNGNTKYAPTNETVLVTVTQIQMPTSIDVDKNIELYVFNSTDIGAVLNPANAGKLTYVSSNSSVVSVDENGLITANGVGEADITVKFEGSAKFINSSETVHVKVKAIPTTMSADSSITVLVGENKTISYIFSNPEAGDVEFVIDDSSVAVIKDGAVVGNKMGKTNLTVLFKGNKNYIGSEATIVINVIKGVTEISAPDTVSLHVGDSVSLNASLTSENKTLSGLIYESSNSSVAAVDENGLITALKSGQANITVRFAESDKYYGASKKVSVSVSLIPTTIDVGKTFSLLINEQEAINAILNPSEAGNLTFTSSDNTVVSIDENGLITAVGEGKANITVSFKGDGKYASASETVLVTVSQTQMPTSIDVDKNIELYVFNSTDIGAVLNPANAGKLTYVSSNSSVVSIDENGLITAKAVGEADITVKFTGDSRFIGSSETVHVKVMAIPTSIEADKSVTIYVGENATVSYIFSNPEAGDVEFIIDNSSVASIKGGIVLGNKVGKTNLTVLFKGNKNYMPSNATILINVIKAVTQISAPDTISLNVADNLSVNATLTSDNKTLSGLIYESSNSDIVKVDKNTGTITAVGAGQANITVSFAESDKYYGASKKVLVTVSLIPTTINVGKTVSLIKGQKDLITAILSPSEAGNLTFTSSDDKVASVDENGLITAVGAGQANITVSFRGDGKYASANATVLVTVTQIQMPTSIEVNKDVELYVFNSTDIGAVLNPANAGKLTYSSTNSSVVSVDENGLITAKGVGEADILVNFAGNDKFINSSEKVHVKVMAIPTTIDADKSMTINLTENATIDYIFSNPEAGNVEFIIEDVSIITIKDGIAVANKVGKTNVTVIFKGNKNYVGSNATVLVEVADVKTAIEASDISVNMTETAKIGAVLTPGEAGKLAFVSSNESVVTVDENGVITGVSVGEADIVISFAGKGKYHESTKTVHVKVTDVETVIAANNLTVNITGTGYIGASLTPKVGDLTYKSSNESVVTVDEKGKITGVSVGEADIVISFAGKGKYRESTKTVHVKVTDVETVIYANDLTINVTEKTNIKARLTPNIGTLSYKSSNESVVSVNERGDIVGVNAGEADITISFAGKTIYRESSKTIHVKVVYVVTEINVNDTISVFVDDSQNIGAVLNPYNKFSLNYTSSNDTIVSVDKDGNIVAHKQGSAVITVSFEGKGKYAPASRNVTVVVSRIPTEIRIDDLDLEIGSGQYIHPSVYPTPRGHNELIYISSNESIVETNGSFIFSKQGGNVTITMIYPGDDKYLPSNITMNITVHPRVTKIIAPETIEIGFGESQTINATLDKDPYAKLTFESSNPEIASVDKYTGRITALDQGNATITIKFVGHSSFYPAEAIVKVVVTSRTTEVKVDKSSFDLHVDDQSRITATVVNAPEGSNVTYISSNIAVVSVDKNGIITANGEGTAIITVLYMGDEDYHSSSANVSVSVSRFSTRIVLDHAFEMKVFDNTNLRAVVNPGEGIMTYKSSNETVVTVNPSGIMTANAVGSAVITITYAGDRLYLPSQKEVIVSVFKVPTSINLTDIELYAGDELKLSNVVTPVGVPTSSRYMTFESYDLDVFDVDSKGVIYTMYEGIAELYVEFKGNDIYLPSNATVMVKVIKRTLTADECQFGIEVSDDQNEATFTLNVPEDAEGSFMVTVDGIPYAEYVEDGTAQMVISELTPGDHKVTMRYTGDLKYASVTNQTTIHVYRIKIDKNKDVSVAYTDRAVYKVHLTRDTQAMENKTVTFKINGKTYYGVTDMLGYASVKLPKLPIKTYTITASYKGIKVTNKITSKHIVVAKDLKAKKTKPLSIKITLNKVNNKVLKYKKVTLKFNGKTYTGKTNSKGVVTFTIAKSVLSKLKVGKSYTYKVTYSKDTVSKKIKIVK